MIDPCPTCSSERYRGPNGNLRCRICAYRRARAWKLKYPDRNRKLNRESANRRADDNRPKTKARYDAIRSDPVLWRKYLDRKKSARDISGSEVRRSKKRRTWLMAGDVTRGQLVRLYVNSKRRCYYCNVIVSCIFKPYAPNGFDHIVPMARGGTHTILNMVVCCHSCNTAKGTRILYPDRTDRLRKQIYEQDENQKADRNRTKGRPVTEAADRLRSKHARHRR